MILTNTFPVSFSASAARILRGDRGSEKSFLLQDRLMRSYENSRLTRPLLDKAHRVVDSAASIVKRSPLKRSFQMTDEQISDSVQCKSQMDQYLINL